MFVAPQRYAMKHPIERRKSMSENVDTICVQGGYQPGNGESRTPPIIQATTFKYKSSEQMSRLFDLSESGYFYTRLQNPTNDTIADLDQALAAVQWFSLKITSGRPYPPLRGAVFLLSEWTRTPYSSCTGTPII